MITAVAAGTSYAHSGQPPRAKQSADPAGRSTLEQRLGGGDPTQGFSFLRTGPGESHVVRQDLARAQPGRERRRRSLIYLTQLTDFQLSDEESPARVEFLDPAPGGATSSAWRPQEALVAHQVEYTIRQVNRFLDSPIRQGDGSRARMANAVLTGDQADNQQRNETEWVVRLLEGGTLNPNSGTANFEGTTCSPPVQALLQTKYPDLAAEAAGYTGFQDYDDYPPGSPVFWDPEQPLGVYADRNWPIYPGLMDRAQQPFQAEGLRVPSYAAFGNHDILAQGNEDAIAPYETVGIGCIKPLAPVPDASSPLANLDPTYLEGVANDPTKAMLVPPDPNRQYVDRRQFKQLHFTGKQADGHGFAYVDPAEREASNGAANYYSFRPKPGVRYVVLDTVGYGGNTADLASGNMDHPQFQWLERTLRQAQERNELILVFGHHATGSMNATTPHELAAPCTSNDAHGHDVNPGCDQDPRSSTPLHHGSDLEALLHRFRNVVAYVAGHSHESRIAPFKSETGGDFWEIKSPAVVDWPPQHRLIEVMDNRDGTLSIFGTLLDHASPTASPPSGNASGFDSATLASIGRTVTYNDPQVGPGEGDEGPEGARTDRNVELLIRDPRARPSDTGAGEDDRPAGEEPDDDDRPGARPAGAGTGTGDLPFTGFSLLPLLVLGALLLLAGGMTHLRLRRSRGG